MLKELSEFPKHHNSSDGRTGICRECKHRRRRQLRVNLSDDELIQVEAIKACEICGSSRKLRLDHNHKTKKFRGVICDFCNTAIGLLGDNPERISRAAQYLRERDLTEAAFD